MNKSTIIDMILEFVDNGAILEYPDQGAKYVVEEKDGEPYNFIGKDIPHGYGESLKVWATAFVEELNITEE